MPSATLWAAISWRTRAYAEGEAALADMLGEDKPYGTQPVPVCTYTIPCFASVGLTTESAKDAGYEPVMGSFDYSANGMALAEGRERAACSSSPTRRRPRRWA